MIDNTSIFSYILLALIIVNAIWFVVSFIKIRKFLENSLQTDATIIKKDVKANNHVSYIVEYDVNGTKIQSNHNLLNKQYNAGEKCNILYSKIKNTNIKLNTFWGIWLLSLIHI